MTKQMKWYSIFDIRKPLMSDEYEVEAKSGSQAIAQYLKSINDSCKAKSSGDNYVELKATPFIIRDNQKYFAGRVAWYKLIYKTND